MVRYRCNGRIHNNMKNQLVACSLQLAEKCKNAFRLFPHSATSYQLPATSSLRGFTLVEMIVAIALFSIVMVVSVGALLALVTANRKAQALQSVMNNLNIALDGM